MAIKKALLVVGALGLVLVGGAAYTYACATCGCSAKKTAAVTRTAPFTVVDVTGAAKGTELCYICRNGGAPSFVIFIRRTDGHIRHLAPEVQKVVDANKAKRVKAFVVLLGEDNTANREALATLAKDLKLTIPLTIAKDGAKGPKAYNLPAKFDTLVLVANENRVLSTVGVNCAKDACGCTKCGKVDGLVAASKTLLTGI